MYMYYIKSIAAITIRVKLSLLIAGSTGAMVNGEVAAEHKAPIWVGRDSEMLSFRATRYTGETLAVGLSESVGLFER
jgi:hypothetical protein